MAFSFLVAGGVFASIWVPELAHWHVRPEPATPILLEEARKTPASERLGEIGDMHLAAVSVDASHILPTAELVLQGTLSLPALDPVPIAATFAPADLDRGLPLTQLAIASLMSADVLLDAYKASGREDYFSHARDIIAAFAQYEARRWVDHASLWNDHAISARIPVLIKFWSLYRARPDFDPQLGRDVVQLVARSGALLAKPSFYAWRTSHGTISDLALLQISAAFPELPKAAEFRRVADQRFAQHLDYWIDAEGVTLLHSAGYHAGSLYHLSMALRLYTLNGLPIPQAWWDRYHKAVEFYLALRRPDGTVPMFGDTMSSPDAQGPRLTARQPDGSAEPLRVRVPAEVAVSSASARLYPVAGHAIWWDGGTTAGAIPAPAAQTLITWSYHPGLGHKLADETSVILWSDGRTWLTNTGYWPYGVQGRDAAESWEGSNAPHLVGESKDSARVTSLRYVSQGDGIAFIDLERKGPGAYGVRRQVVRLTNSRSWIVLDYVKDAADRTSTTQWTFYPDLMVTAQREAGVYKVMAPGLVPTMLAAFSGSAGQQVQPVSGNLSPFAGWVVQDRTPAPATAIVTRASSRDSWSLASFALQSPVAGQADAGRPARMDTWTNAEHWSVVIPSGTGEARLTRDGTRLLVQRAGARDAALDLTAPPATTAGLQAVRAAFDQAAATYHRFPEIIYYRLRISHLLLVALVAQELLLLVVQLWRPHIGRRLRVTTWGAWVAGGVWLYLVYFTATS